MYDNVKAIMNFMAYADGRNDLLDISNLISVPVKELADIARKLENHGIISRFDKYKGENDVCRF